jgi:hypothetical protein
MRDDGFYTTATEQRFVRSPEFKSLIADFKANRMDKKLSIDQFAEYS